MRPQKKSALPKDSTVELESAEADSKAWVDALASLENVVLAKGETTIRKLASDCDLSYMQAKEKIQKLMRAGLVEFVDQRVMRQDGNMPARVSVYRLTHARKDRKS